MKKFEEGVFSDLRNLKPGVDACLEEPKVSFLSLCRCDYCISLVLGVRVYQDPFGRIFISLPS